MCVIIRNTAHARTPSEANTPPSDPVCSGSNARAAPARGPPSAPPPAAAPHRRRGGASAPSGDGPLCGVQGLQMRTQRGVECRPYFTSLPYTRTCSHLPHPTVGKLDKCGLVWDAAEAGQLALAHQREDMCSSKWAAGEAAFAAACCFSTSPQHALLACPKPTRLRLSRFCTNRYRANWPRKSGVLSGWTRRRMKTMSTFAFCCRAR